MRVLVACEFSGRVRDAFLARGHDAYSCDILPTPSERKDRHLWGDVRPVLKREWDLIIAHPPCTYITRAAASHFKRNPMRVCKMWEAVEFFLQCLNANSPRVCVENPMPYHLASERIGVKYSQIVHPWMFGGTESKATCLWLRGLPNLVPDVRERPEGTVSTRSRGRSGNLAGGGRTPLLRSLTHPGLARAMAEQWG